MIINFGLIVKAVQSLRPGSQFSLRGIDENTGYELLWHDTEQSLPTDEEIADEMARLGT